MLLHEKPSNVGMIVTGLKNPWMIWLKETGAFSRKISISAAKVGRFPIQFDIGEKLTCLKSCLTLLMRSDIK